MGLNNNGFSLIEILVAVAIIGILAAIAVPQYSQFIVKGKIQNAQSDLAALSLVMESAKQRTLAYKTINKTQVVSNLLPQWQASSDQFLFQVESNGDQFLLLAIGLGVQVHNCKITLNNEGVKSLSGGECIDFGNAWL